MDKNKLKDKAKKIEATIRIGKNGLTYTMLDEIKKQLKTKKLVKIKMLKTFIEDKNKKEVAEEIATKCKAVLIDLVGFVVVIYRS